MDRGTDDDGAAPSNWVEELHRAIASHARLAPASPQTRDETDEAFDEIRDCLTLLDRARRPRPPGQSPGGRVGRFEILREIGRGGFGVVFAAIDPSVGRQVALKVPRPEVLADPAARERFLREAKAAGALSHPNLIPIYEVGHEEPFCYIASALCEGPTLAQWLADQRAPLSLRTATELVRGLASGVEHAHERGVLHRDIKPSNVLVELPGGAAANGVPQPRLTDFGLAKLLESADEHTHTGALMGTPAYMAPEQAEGRWRDVGPATDVYALGVLLFELLTGRPPLHDESNVQTLQLVARGEVPPPTRFRPGIPRDLEAIVLKCLEREPERRYSSARQLVDDLGRYLEGQPTVARAATPVDRAWKWAKRRPATATLAVVALAAVLALSGGGWWYSGRLRAALDEVRSQKLETERHLYAASMTVAEEALRTNQVGHTYEQLARWIPDAGQPDHRGFPWRYLWRQLNQQERTLRGHAGDVYCVRFSPDSSLLATASQDGSVRLWDAATGACLRVLEGDQGEVNCVAFSPQGDRVASAGDDGTVCLWRTADGALVTRYPRHKGGAYGVAFSPRGETLASCGADGAVKLFDVARGTLLRTFHGHADSVGALAFSTDGRFLATASDDATARLWNVATGAQVLALPHEGPVNCLSLASDSHRLLTGQRSKRLVRRYDLAYDGAWGVAPAASAVVQDTHDWIHAIAFDPADASYVLATKDGMVEQYDARTDALVRPLRGHRARVWSVAFSGDGRRLATASADRTVRVWNLAGRPGVVFNRGAVRSISLTADKRTMAIADNRGRLATYDVASGQRTWTVGRDFDLVGDFDGDGQRDVGHFHDGLWRWTSAASGSAGPQALRFGTADDVPIVGDWDGDGRDNLGCYRPDDGTWTFDLDGQGGAAEASCRPPQLAAHVGNPCVPVAGRWETPDRDSVGLAVLEPRGQFAFWFPRGDGFVRVATDKDRHFVPFGGRWHYAQPDGWGLFNFDEAWLSTFRGPGGKLAEGGDDALPDPLQPHPAKLDAAAFYDAYDRQNCDSQAVSLSPDGKLLAVGFWSDDRVRIWNVQTSERIAVLMPATAICDVLFSPDGQTLAIGTNDGQLHLYDGRTFELRHSIQAHVITTRKLAYDATGALLATAGDSGQPVNIRIWDRDARLVHAFGDARMGRLTTIALAPDGTCLASGSDDGGVVLWSLATGQRIAELAGHIRGIEGLAFSPDQSALATFGEDGRVLVWDLATRQALFAMAEGLDPMGVVAFSQDDLIAVGSREGRGEIRFWSAQATELPAAE